LLYSIVVVVSIKLCIELSVLFIYSSFIVAEATASVGATVTMQGAAEHLMDGIMR
jgi:hypothetical protein